MKRLVLGFFGLTLLVGCGSSGTPTATTSSGGATATIAVNPTSTIQPISTTAPSPTIAAPGPGKIGEQIQTDDGMALTVLSVQQKNELDALNGAKDGIMYVVAEVVIENISSDRGSYNQLYFSLKDADGFKIDPTFSSNSDMPNLKTGTLAKGEKARGFIPFELKKDTKGLILIYESIAMKNPVRIALDQ